MLTIDNVPAISGKIRVPGDKSISHRAVMFAAISKGISHIRGFLQGGDCLSTIGCFRALGVNIENDGGIITVHGRGLFGLQKPFTALDAGNSGTTMRLMSGILAGQCFETVINGDESLRRRPMRRVIEPLQQMGAGIRAGGERQTAPLHISGGQLRGITWQSGVASAQVKSAILLAGLYAQGETAVTEPFLSRDHSERMLRAFGANLRSDGNTATISPGNDLYGCDVEVPGDISSAAFWLAAAAMLPGSDLTVEGVGINPSRTGIIDVLQKMGAAVEISNTRMAGCEPLADIRVRGGSLNGIVIGGEMIPRLVDEVPVIAALAMQAEGDTLITGAAELRVKESDRLAVIAGEFRKFGAIIDEQPDGLIISGGKKIRGATIDSHGDHRIAMAAAIAGLAAEGKTRIINPECIDISYPDFDRMLCRLSER